jgi:trehalose 6-phosphate phosphatase
LLKTETPPLIEPFLRSVAEASHRLLMLDYDGTLAPFRKERDRAFPYPDIAAALDEIVRSGHTRVVIVSGREVDQIAFLLGIQPMPELWGVHGLQRRRPNGALEMAPLEAWHLNALSNARRWLEYQQLTSLAEMKTGSIAAHWRGLSVPEMEEVRGRVLLGWKAIADDTGLFMMEFDGGLEIRAPGRDKGDVVCTLLQEMSPDVRAAYLGDDLTDEPAFRAIGERGLSILVRPQWRNTAARLWLKPPEGVVDFLTGWQDSCRRHDAVNDEKAGAANG